MVVLLVLSDRDQLVSISKYQDVTGVECLDYNG
jgi:hypothetical protein